MAKFRPLRRAGDVPRQVAELVLHAEQVDAALVLNSQIVEGVIVAGASTATVRHSLGRAYRGAMLMGVTTTSGVPLLAVVHPDSALAAGVPIAEYVQVACPTPPADDERFTLLVM